MSGWRSKVSTFLSSWRRAHDEVKRAKDARRDQRADEELERARAGVDRFPPMGA